MDEQAKRSARTTRSTAVEWPRADPGDLAKFDPATKQCVQNCGPHKHDPRCAKERMFLCADCVSFEDAANKA